MMKFAGHKFWYHLGKDEPRVTFWVEFPEGKKTFETSFCLEKEPFKSYNIFQLWEKAKECFDKFSANGSHEKVKS